METNQCGAAACGQYPASGCSALNKPWKVVEGDANYIMEGVYPDGRGGKAKCEDMSILTEDDYEVVGCSEWMRAHREVFDHIVALHNASLQNPTADRRASQADKERK